MNIKPFLSIFLACILATGIALELYLKHYMSNWGLQANFYKGENFNQYITSGKNSTIDFDRYYEMNSRIPPEEFSARWQGYLLVPHDAVYTFSLKVDDGARLFIDKKLLIDQWHINDSVEYTSRIFLAQGKHLFCLDYFNHRRKAALKLFIQEDGRNKTIVPSHYFRIPDNAR